MEVFMKVMNGLVSRGRQEIFMCLAALLIMWRSNVADSRMKAVAKISIKFYFMRSFFSFSVYSAAVKC